MSWRIAATLIVATILTGTHWKAYESGNVAGKKTVQAEWDKDIQVRIEQALEDERAARAREQQLVAAKHKAEEDHAAFKRRTQRAVAGAQSELDRLRDALAARSSAPTAPTSARVDAVAPIERELFGRCAETLAGVAQQADQLAAQVTGLQGYVRSVCTTP